MKKFYTFAVVLCLTAAVTLRTSAGEIQTDAQPTPSPTPLSAVPGEIQTDSKINSEGSSTDAFTEAVIAALSGVLGWL